RGIAAGEDVFAQPRIGAARRFHAADGMQQHDPVLGKQVLRLAEELAIMRGADMLEHADGDDAVEGTRLQAVVAQEETDAIAEARRGRPLLRELVLLGGEGDAGDVDAGEPGEIEAEAAPAAADVEQLLTRLEQELRRKMQLLVRLRRLQV